MWCAGLLDRLPAGVGHAFLAGWREPTAADHAERDRHRSDLDWWVRQAAAALASRLL